MNKISIIYDTREQKPLTFERFLENNNLELIKDTLSCGDYTLGGFDIPCQIDDSIIIERKKDCQELIGNLGTNWERFKNELEQMSKFKHKFILVCGDQNFQWLYDKKYTKLSPAFIFRQLAQIQINYGISIIFLGNRESVEEYIFRIFKRIIDKNE